jgi:subtilisin family serine protease
MSIKPIVPLLAGAISLGIVGSASAETYVVLAKGNSFSSKTSAEIQAAGGRITSLMPQIGVALVEADAGFASEAAAISGLQSVAADVSLQFVDEMAAPQRLTDSGIGSDETGDGSFPTDSFGFLQWNMDAIDAPEAHAAGVRGAGVRVAILDSGIDSAHVDLVGNLNVALSTSFVPGEDFDNPPGGHGTHVAGTVAAGLNGFGVVGVAPEAELVSVKVLSAVTGSGSFGGIIGGIVYAADIDADVINMSLGIPGGLPRNIPGIASLVNATQRAITYAYQNGTTVVASSGNDARDMDHDASVISFPGGLADVITVAATGPMGWAFDLTGTDLDRRASYSNYGQSTIDFSGPGGDFAYPGNEICIFGIPCWVFDMQISTVPGDSYGWSAGTSMAAPHVAGVAALIIGANGGDMHPAQVKAALMASSEDLGKPGRDDTHGHGRVNALNAAQ